MLSPYCLKKKRKKKQQFWESDVTGRCTRNQCVSHALIIVMNDYHLCCSHRAAEDGNDQFLRLLSLICLCKRHFTASEEMCLNKIRITGCERGASLWWGPSVETNCVCSSVVHIYVCVCVCGCRQECRVCVWCAQESSRTPCHMINVLSLIIYVLQNMMYVRMNFEL